MVSTTDYRQLVQDRADLQAKADGIFPKFQASKTALRKDPENEELTAQVNALSKDYDAVKGELKQVEAQIADEEEHRELVRSRAAKRFEADSEEDEAATFRQKQAQKEARPYESFGEQLLAIHAARMGDAEAIQRLKINAAASGATEGVSSDGGYLVQKDFANEIMSRMAGGQLLSRVRRVPISGNSNGIKINVVDETSRATGSRWGGVQGYWLNEGNAPTASKPKFAQVGLELNKLIALGYATDELLADAAALDSVMTQAFAEELTFLAENAILNGSGAGQPLGILNAPATVSQAKETGQAAATVLSTNISKMWARLHARSRANAVWLYNQDVEPTLDELYITAGTGALEPRTVSYGPDGVLRIKGAPAIATEYNATLGTVGDLVLVDLSQYALIDKGGVQQAQSIHVAFTTDETAFRATYRVDGQPMWKSALTPFKGSNTQSPFISLATRA